MKKSTGEREAQDTSSPAGGGSQPSGEATRAVPGCALSARWEDAQPHPWPHPHCPPAALPPQPRCEATQAPDVAKCPLGRCWGGRGREGVETRSGWGTAGLKQGPGNEASSGRPKPGASHRPAQQKAGASSLEGVGGKSGFCGERESCRMLRRRGGEEPQEAELAECQRSLPR